MSDWIRAEDRLPRAWRWVLTFSPSHGHKVAFRLPGDGTRTPWEIPWDDTENVTHWQHLPPKPRKRSR